MLINIKKTILKFLTFTLMFALLNIANHNPETAADIYKNANEKTIFIENINDDIQFHINKGNFTNINITDPGLTNSDSRLGDFPYGLFDFTIAVDTPGDSIIVTVTLPDPAPEGYSWFKYNDSSGWNDFSEFVTFNEVRYQISITLTDGGFGDDDGVENGIIVDPSGLGMSDENEGDDTDEGTDDSSSCFITSLF